MAAELETLTLSGTLPRTARSVLPWRRIVPLALLVPIVVAFGSPVFAFALLAAVLAAPVVVGALAWVAVKSERR
jgi:hypothetical protein